MISEIRYLFCQQEKEESFRNSKKNVTVYISHGPKLKQTKIWHDAEQMAENKKE